MKLEYDKKKILNLLNDFSNCTNLIASFHFNTVDLTIEPITNFAEATNTANIVDRQRDDIYSHFCNYVQSDKKCLEKCKRDDFCYKELAKRERRMITYCCHAGLSEVISPVIIDNVVIGFIMCGKFIDKENKYSSPEKIELLAEQHNLDEQVLLSLRENLPVVSQLQISSAMNILNICITHLIKEHFLQLKNQTLIEEINDYIVKNISSPLSVELICRTFYINRQKLYLLFKEYNHTSVKEFILFNQMEKAKELLNTTKDSIEEVASQVGFSDYNYFIRIFRKKIGVSPLKYRKNKTSSTQSIESNPET